MSQDKMLQLHLFITNFPYKHDMNMRIEPLAGFKPAAALTAYFYTVNKAVMLQALFITFKTVQ